MSDATDGIKPETSLTLGCDPMVTVTITENFDGSLFVALTPTDPAASLADIDGLFFNLAQDSTLDGLNFFPDPNTGSIFSPVTGLQTNANSVDTLNNGAQVAEGYDIGVQFGTTDSSTAGNVTAANFTLFSDNGPLSISDLDLTNMAAVVDSDAGNGQVLTVKDAPNDDPVFIEKVSLFENFDDIHDPADSDAVVSDGHWGVRHDQLFTNGCNDGTIEFAEVDTDGPASFCFDARAANLSRFENGGHYGDSLTLQVQLDGGDWVTIDTFEVNHDKSALVGDQSGNEITHASQSFEYSGGLLDDADDTVQFRFISDISASDEQIFIDNVSVKTTMEMAPGDPVLTEQVVQADDFEDLHEPADSDIIESDGHWDVRAHTSNNDTLFTNGYNDGTLTFEEVAVDGAASFSFDAKAPNAHAFENGGHYGDSLEVQVKIDGGDWVTLDTYVVNHAGDALVGSETGNEIGTSFGPIEYSGGVLDDAQESVQFRMISDISANNEQIWIDNVEVKALIEEENGDKECEDFDSLAAGDVVSDQFHGVTITAQREGDDANSENDAMIFDTNNPTGGDHDLEYADQGNVIIISEDNDSDDPDDNAHGGTISFDFEAPSEVVSLNFLDIEEPHGTVDLFDAEGTLLNSLEIPVSGDNGMAELMIDTANVSSMDVNLAGSGAIDDLCYFPADGAECDAQYDASYVAGLPILPMVDPEDWAEAAEEEIEELGV
ncbi:MAG: hypothetical protein AB8B51_15000 [Sedimentitalea sp.]